MRRVSCVVALGVAIGVLLAPSASARPIDKLGSQLRGLVHGKPLRAKPATASVQLLPISVRGGKALVDVYVHGPMRAGTKALRREGMHVAAISGRAPERMVEGWVPIKSLDDVAGLRRTKAVLPVHPSILDTGGTLSEGDAAHQGPQARALGATGADVPVGVISDSINKVGGGVTDSQASGDLPPDVQIIDDSAPSGTDEGRAMAEVVYDTAPGIPRILFSRGVPGGAVHAASIDALAANGAKVIVDDITNLGEPFFQDGVVSQAVDRAKANGVAYLASAGNRARQSWEGTFTPVGSPALNDFDLGAGQDTRQTLATVPSGGKLTIFVQWDEPFGGATSDFALDFYSEPGGSFITTAHDSGNVTARLPVQAANLTGPGTFSMAIRRISGSGTPRLKWIANKDFAGTVPIEFATNSQAINPDAASARGALAVAAVNYADSGLNSVESFSSRGPTVTRYLDASGAQLATPDVRAKPDVAGADRVSTSMAAFTPFPGTSAAAPSVAGVVALLRSARPSLTVDQIYSIMRDPRSSIDCTAPGSPDADCGSGFALADAKVKMALDATPPLVSPVLFHATTASPSGWFHGNVGLVWSVSDPDSPLTSQSGCDPQAITTDGVVSFTCTAVSVGGTTNQPVTIKRDTVPPSPPRFIGISPGASFTAPHVPAPNAIGCTATDATSGVASCVVTGYAASAGQHTLTATATDASGLESTAILTYSVKRLASRLRIASNQTIGSVLRSGFKCKIDLALDRTKLTATLEVGSTKVGRLRTTRNRGTRTLAIKLNQAGKRKLNGARKAKFALAIKATSAGATAATLRGSRTLKR